MTEYELRKRVCAIMAGWVGGARGSAQHLDILKTYNEYRPLARGYRMQVRDDWCACTVSAAFIRAGIASFTGTECSCGAFITLAKARGIWIEDDARRPEISDAIIYAWSDDGKGDNTTGHNHIGIVTALHGDTFTVTEGNKGKDSKVATRLMKVNDMFTRGFICPDYKAIAAATEAPIWAMEAAYKAAHKGVFIGDGKSYRWGDNLTRGEAAVIMDRLGLLD